MVDSAATFVGNRVLYALFQTLHLKQCLPVANFTNEVLCLCQPSLLVMHAECLVHGYYVSNITAILVHVCPFMLSINSKIFRSAWLLIPSVILIVEIA